MPKAIINAKIYTGDQVIESGFIRFGNTILDVGEMEDYESIQQMK